MLFLLFLGLKACPAVRVRHHYLADTIRPHFLMLILAVYLCTTPEGGSEHLLSTRNPHVHAQKRRYWNHAFTPTAVKDYDDLIGSRARQFLDYLSGQHGVVDLSAWIDYFTRVPSSV